MFKGINYSLITALAVATSAIHFLPVAKCESLNNDLILLNHNCGI